MTSFFEHYYMNVCAEFTSDKTDDVTSDPPGGSEVGSRPARKTDDVTPDPPERPLDHAVGKGVILDFCMDFGRWGMPLEGESYWTFVWTLGWGRPFEGESYLVFVWTLGEGAPVGKGVVLDLCMVL